MLTGPGPRRTLNAIRSGWLKERISMPPWRTRTGKQAQRRGQRRRSSTARPIDGPLTETTPCSILITAPPPQREGSPRNAPCRHGTRPSARPRRALAWQVRWCRRNQARLTEWSAPRSLILTMMAQDHSHLRYRAGRGRALKPRMRRRAAAERCKHQRLRLPAVQPHETAPCGGAGGSGIRPRRRAQGRPRSFCAATSSGCASYSSSAPPHLRATRSSCTRALAPGR